MTARPAQEQFALSALLGLCETTLKIGVVDNETQFRFVLNQARTALGLPALQDPGAVVVKTASHGGFHAHDDVGNHGFGRTKDEALAEYQRERELFSDDVQPDHGLQAFGQIVGISA